VTGEDLIQLLLPRVDRLLMAGKTPLPGTAEAWFADGRDTKVLLRPPQGDLGEPHLACLLDDGGGMDRTVGQERTQVADRLAPLRRIKAGIARPIVDAVLDRTEPRHHAGAVDLQRDRLGLATGVALDDLEDGAVR